MQERLKRLKKENLENKKRLMETQKINKKMEVKEKRKRIHAPEPDTPFEEFYDRIQKKTAQKERTINRLKELYKDDGLERTPHINEKSKELTENISPLLDRMEKDKRAKSLLSYKTSSAKRFSFKEQTPEKKEKEIKQKKKDEINARNSAFYIKSINWKKDSEDRNFFKKVELVQKQDRKNVIPKRKVQKRLNKSCNRNVRTFDERTMDFVKKKQAGIDKASQDVYNYSFTPSLFKRK